MFSDSFSSTSSSAINHDIFLVKYRYHSRTETPLPIVLHSEENSFEDLKKMIIQSYFWNCEGKNCATKNDCSCLPEVHNIHLWWWSSHDDREILHLCAPSHIATPPHPILRIQENIFVSVIFVSDNKKLRSFLREYALVHFDVVPN